MSLRKRTGKRLGRPPGSKPKSTGRALHECRRKIVYPTWKNATRKQLGELAEMMFMVRATMKGHVVAKPFGECQRYDFLVDSGKRTWRVQVKSSTCTHWRAYTVNAYWKTTRKHMPYLPSKVDFLAVVILGTDIWYLIPVRALAGRLLVRVYPFGGDPRGSRRFEKYRDAWHLLQPKKRPHPRSRISSCATDTPARRL
ncbi:MAG: group I intron-associated PD-(D/E)XK endonuclease [Candidatus Sulfotelmatobacter sp.]